MKTSELVPTKVPAGPTLPLAAPWIWAAPLNACAALLRCWLTVVACAVSAAATLVSPATGVPALAAEGTLEPRLLSVWYATTLAWVVSGTGVNDLLGVRPLP